MAKPPSPSKTITCAITWGDHLGDHLSLRAATLSLCCIVRLKEGRYRSHTGGKAQSALAFRKARTIAATSGTRTVCNGNCSGSR
ncbi:MAG TPA: hypothetical protein VG986_18700, partial [Pseudolabrys sp.]|nr:hypothetical protein [Pseudolabrys sp.]